jgi:hypothetical protein
MTLQWTHRLFFLNKVNYCSFVEQLSGGKVDVKWLLAYCYGWLPACGAVPQTVWDWCDQQLVAVMTYFRSTMPQGKLNDIIIIFIIAKTPGRGLSNSNRDWLADAL